MRVPSLKKTNEWLVNGVLILLCLYLLLIILAPLGLFGSVAGLIRRIVVY